MAYDSRGLIDVNDWVMMIAEVMILDWFLDVIRRGSMIAPAKCCGRGSAGCN